MQAYVIKYAPDVARERQRQHDVGERTGDDFDPVREVRFADMIEVDGGAVIFYAEGEISEVVGPGTYLSVRNIDMFEE